VNQVKSKRQSPVDLKSVHPLQLVDLPVLTLAEAAAYLRLSADEVAAMVDARALPGARIGSDYRIPTAGMLAWLNGGHVEPTVDVTSSAATQPVRSVPSFSFQKDKPFTYTWPMNSPELYKETYVSRSNSGGVKIIKIGFCERKSGGMSRKRAVVFLDGYPTVEFTAANDFSTSELMAGILKGADKAQVRPELGVPSEYQHLRVEPYNAHVVGPYCSRNLAVICKKSDLAVMAEHALIRRCMRS